MATTSMPKPGDRAEVPSGLGGVFRVVLVKPASCNGEPGWIVRNKGNTDDFDDMKPYFVAAAKVRLMGSDHG